MAAGNAYGSASIVLSFYFVLQLGPRTIWAKSNPDVQSAVKSHCAKSGAQQRKNLRSDCAKAGNGLRRNLRTTNNNTKKETMENTIATPSPLPAGGRAPASLIERMATQQARRISPITVFGGIVILARQTYGGLVCWLEIESVVI